MTRYIEEESANRPAFETGPVRRFFDAVNSLSTTLEPYFAVISTFVQTDPRISGLVWGSMLLIFKVRIRVAVCNI
jgi:hypothetical protein